MGQPRRVEDYELLGPLGEGGMGQVWEARHPGLPGRRLALKQATGVASREDRLRFRREAELLARVHHPGVVQVHAIGEAPGGPWLVMDLVEGEPLVDALRRGPFPCEQAVRLVERLGEALIALHRDGIVHRDLKPANVLLRADGTPVLVDFGLAWAGDVQRLTQTGTLLGTPAYMAPELIEDAARVDPRVDVYGLGALLFALVCGRGPFSGPGLMPLLRRVLSEPPEWPAPGAPGSELPAPVRRAIEAALEKDPARRPARIEDLLALLRAPAAPGPRGRRRLVAAAGALASIALSIALLAWGTAAPPPAWAPALAPPTAPVSTPQAPLGGPAADAQEAPRRVLERGWQGGLFLGPDVVVWNGEHLRQVGTAPAEVGWQVSLRGPLQCAQPMPDGALAWTEALPRGARVVHARDGQETWSLELGARSVTGIAVWPDEQRLTIAAEAQGGALQLARGQLLVVELTQGSQRAQDDVPRPLPKHDLGPIAAVGSHLLLMRSTMAGSLNRVVPWSAGRDATGDEWLVRDGDEWQVTLERELLSICADRGRAWVGDDDGRIYRLEVPRQVAARDERLFQVHSADLPPTAGAHPPGHAVTKLRCAPGSRLWSLARPASGPAELRAWDVSGEETRPRACLRELSPAADFDLDASGSRLLLVLPGDGVWVVPTALVLREGPIEWPALRARAQERE